MISVNVRELKQQASELVRVVRETGNKVQITAHGKVVALLIPAEKVVSQREETAWMKLDQLAAEIGAHWPEDASAAETISEGRQ